MNFHYLRISYKPSRVQVPQFGSSLVVQRLGLHASTAGATEPDPWLRNQDPTGHAVWPKEKKKHLKQVPKSKVSVFFACQHSYFSRWATKVCLRLWVQGLDHNHEMESMNLALA